MGGKTTIVRQLTWLENTIYFPLGNMVWKNWPGPLKKKHLKPPVKNSQGNKV